MDYAMGIMDANGSAVAYVMADASKIPTPDARLIASAPEMLEALKIALDEFDGIVKHIIEIHGLHPLESTPSIIRSAIAKAEGGAE